MIQDGSLFPFKIINAFNKTQLLRKGLHTDLKETANLNAQL